MHILQNLNGFTHGAFSALVCLLLVKGWKLKGYQHPSQPYLWPPCGVTWDSSQRGNKAAANLLPKYNALNPKP